MENSFNLVDEPWIPVVGAGRASLMEIFTNAELRALGGSAVQKIALTKLLLAIAQAAATPKDDPEWLAMGWAGLAGRCTEYLEKWRHKFFLYGDAPFLQMPAIARAEIVSFGAVLPEVSTGNTTVLSQMQAEGALDDAERAVLIVSLMGFALGGKKADNSVVLAPDYMGKCNDKGKPSSGRAGPSVAFLGLLHSMCLGTTLMRTIWLNLLTIADLVAPSMFSGGVGIAPWEDMPVSETCAVARSLQCSLIGRLVPMSRFCLLAESGMHYSEGVAHPGYKDGVVDPTVAVNYSGKDPKVLWANPERRPWRELTALLAFLQEQNSSFNCLQLSKSMPRASQLPEPFAIWSGGLRVSSNAGEQYVSGTDDAVESTVWLHGELFGSLWFESLKEEMAMLETMSKAVYGCTNSYFKQLLMEGEGQAGQASNVFWQLSERHVQQLLDSCAADAEAIAARKALRRRFAGYVSRAYEQFCPRDTARQIDAWAKARPNLSKFLFEGSH